MAGVIETILPWVAGPRRVQFMVGRKCFYSPASVLGLFLGTEFISFKENFLEITRVTIIEATRGSASPSYMLRTSEDLTAIMHSTTFYNFFFFYPHHYFLLACLYCQAIHPPISICFISIKHNVFLVGDTVEKSRNNMVYLYFIDLSTPQIRVGKVFEGKIYS